MKLLLLGSIFLCSPCFAQSIDANIYKNYDLLVKTNPPGEYVYLDDKLLGKSPLSTKINGAYKDIGLMITSNDFWHRYYSKIFYMSSPIPHVLNIDMPKLGFSDLKIPILLIIIFVLLAFFSSIFY